MEDRLSKLQKLRADAQGIYGNIEWNLAGLIAAAILIQHPEMLFLPNIPRQVTVNGLALDGFQLMGLTLRHAERAVRSNELIAAAKRSLICEAFEVGTEMLVRAIHILHSGHDPYELEDGFSANFSDTWSSRKERAGSLLEDQERKFFRECVAPLRNWIRHNNGKIPPNEQLSYSGTPRKKRIDICLQWEKDADNNIKLGLNVAWDIFETVRDIVLEALKRAEERTQSEGKLLGQG